MEYATLRDKIRAEKAERAQRYTTFANLLEAAQLAGVAAALAAVPTPMNVRDGRGGQVWHVAEGACGFAWVTIRPATSSFARWLVKEGKARAAYGGGVQIWIGAYNQSVARKEAHAYAMADVLREAGIKAYAGSRLD